MSRTAVQSRFLTLDQVAEDLQLSRRTIERLVAAEILPSVRVGGSRRVAVAELDEWIGLRSVSADGQPSSEQGSQLRAGAGPAERRATGLLDGDAAARGGGR